MRAAVRVFGRAIGDTWYQLVGYTACNIVVVLGSLLVIPAPALLVGLLQVSTESARYNERPEVSALLHAARARFFAAWRLAAVELLGVFLLGVSIYFYAAIGTTWALPLVALTFTLSWAWLGVIFYASALLVRSERGVWIAIRNSLVVFTRYPLFSTTLLFLSFLVFLLSLFVAPLFVLVTFSFYAVLATRATTWALRKEGLLPPETAPQEQPVEF
ncbi:MAG: hypothetical protein M3506_05760 [Chloroflexota bacterium]|nr:hypothetical protein [Chloroflexota bacterium]